jgi:LysR family transcriptional regulator of gallate degradation
MQIDNMYALPMAESVGAGPVIPHDSSFQLATSSRIDPNLRRLRAYLAVYECGGVQRASEKLHLTQSSLTRAVQELERQLGIALFERTRRGMIATDFADLLAERARRALAHLDAAEQESLAVHADAGSAARSLGFSAKFTHRQLSALIGIADHQTETGAAQQLALSQPAITLALRDLEQLVGEPLFLRTARGMIPTVYGEILVRRAKLAFSEIAAAGADIAARVGLITGRVVVGALPLSGALLTPRAINLLLREHPQLQVTVVDGTYQSLIQGLLCGDIDLIVGGLNYQLPREVVQEPLFQDSLSVVVRKGHPLLAKRNLTLSDLRGVEWVVPRPGTPARMCLDQVMLAAGLELGINPIESNALLTVRALVMESDRLAVISRHQIHFEEFAGMLAVLPLNLAGAALPIGVRTRADSSLSAGVNALLRHLRAVSAQMRVAPH